LPVDLRTRNIRRVARQSPAANPGDGKANLDGSQETRNRERDDGIKCARDDVWNEMNTPLTFIYIVENPE